MRCAARAGLVEQLGAPVLVLREFGGAVERPLRLGAERERECPPPSVGERLARGRADPGRVRRVGIGSGGIEEVCREHLGQLGRLLAPCLLQMARGGEVAALAVAARERAVGGGPEQRLKEVVLAALG